MIARFGDSLAWSMRAPHSCPYARVGNDGVGYAGRMRRTLPQGEREDCGVRAGGGFWPDGRRFGCDRDRQRAELGVASTQLVHALMEEHVLAVIALDRDSAHLAEQLSLKTFVPVVALVTTRR